MRKPSSSPTPIPDGRGRDRREARFGARPPVAPTWVVPLLSLALLSSLQLGSPSMAVAQWEGAPVDTVAGSDQDEHSYPSSLALDVFDQPHAVWRAPVSGRTGIFYSRKTQGSWSDPIEVGSDGGWHTTPALAVQAGTDIPTAVFAGHLTGETDGDIYLARWNGSGFDAARLTDDDSADSDPDLFLGASGAYHVVDITQVSGEWRLRYLTDVTGQPLDLLVEGGPLGPYGSGAAPAIAADAAGRVHITYRGLIGGRYRIVHAYNDAPGSSNWSWEALASGNADDYSSDIAVDGTGALHVGLGGNDCWGCISRTDYLRKPPDGPWDHYVTINHSLGLSFSSLALDPAGGAHMAMEEVSGNILTGRIFYAGAPAGWSAQFVIGDDHMAPSLLVDAGGHGNLLCTTGPNTGWEDVLYIRSTAPVVGVQDQPASAALRLRASPNPFRDETWIVLTGAAGASSGGAGTLRGGRPVGLSIYDAAGRRVRTLASAPLATGGGSLRWDGRDEAGREVAAGIYSARWRDDAAVKLVRVR